MNKNIAFKYQIYTFNDDILKNELIATADDCNSIPIVKLYMV